MCRCQVLRESKVDELEPLARPLDHAVLGLDVAAARAWAGARTVRHGGEHGRGRLSMGLDVVRDSSALAGTWSVTAQHGCGRGQFSIRLC
eukprot:284290-Chlamydomonas_euryale.AAC.1